MVDMKDLVGFYKFGKDLKAITLIKFLFLIHLLDLI